MTTIFPSTTIELNPGISYPQLEPVLKRSIQIVEPDYVGPRAPSIGFLLRMEGGRVASKGQPRGFTTEVAMVW